MQWFGVLREDAGFIKLLMVGALECDIVDEGLLTLEICVVYCFRLEDFCFMECYDCDLAFMMLVAFGVVVEIAVSGVGIGCFGDCVSAVVVAVWSWAT